MRELRLEEILAIAGGMPPGAALDECCYRTPAEPLHDPVAYRQLPADELSGHAPN